MGVQLGDFILEKRIGAGGMGQVFLGKQVSLDRTVAVKVMPKTMAGQSDSIRRFEREAKAAANLVHPNVIQIYHFGVERDVPYFAMEFVEGKDLDQKMRAGIRFSLEESVDIIIGVTKALECACRQNIVHRDIKPSNVMLTSDGTVKVMDFGLAKVQQVQDQSITQDGMIIGTPHYMSPEQGKGEKLDTRSDIYSLGVVFYQLLTGQLPFKADTPTAMIYQHAYEKPKAPNEVNPDVPDAVNSIVMKMLEKDPDHRYQHPTGLLRDLDQYKRGMLTAEAFEKRDSSEIHAMVTQPMESVGPVKEKKSHALLIVLIALLVTVAGAAAAYVLVMKPEWVFPETGSTGLASETGTADTGAASSTASGTAPAAKLEYTLALSKLKNLVTDKTTVYIRKEGSEELVLVEYKDVEKEPGKYELEFKRPGYEDLSKEIALGAAGASPSLDTLLLEFQPTEKLTAPYGEAEILFAGGEYEKALAKYEEVAELDPAFRNTRERIIACRQKIDRLKEQLEKDKNAYELARKFFNHQQYGKVEAAVSDISIEGPYYDEGQKLKKEAEDTMRKIARNLSDARSHMRDGNYDGMGLALNEVEKDQPENPELKKLRTTMNSVRLNAKNGFSEFENGNFRTARKLLENVIGHSPNYRKAQEVFAEADKLVKAEDAKIARVKNLAAEAEKSFRGKDYEKTIELCKELLALDEKHARGNELIEQAAKRKNNIQLEQIIANIDTAIRMQKPDELFRPFTPDAENIETLRKGFETFRSEGFQITRAKHEIKDMNADNKAGTATVETVWRFEMRLPDTTEHIRGDIKRIFSFIRKRNEWFVCGVRDVK